MCLKGLRHIDTPCSAKPVVDAVRNLLDSIEVDVGLLNRNKYVNNMSSHANPTEPLEEFERAGCRVIFLERPPSGDPQDALVIQIRGAVAEYERTVIADRMRRGRLAALRAGRLLPWTTPPYGYRVDPRMPRDPAGVRVEDSEAGVVCALFGWYAEEGLTIYAIAQRLTERGIATARGHAIWTPAAVRRILGNASYCGMAYGNRLRDVPAKRRHPLLGGTTKGTGGTSVQARPAEEWIGVPVPAIVSTELYAQVQARLGRNRTWAMRNTRRAYLLRCLVHLHRDRVRNC